MADIPIKYGKFKDTDGVVKKAYFVNTEKAIYDNDNQPLDQKLIGMKNTINSLQETIVGLQNSIAKLNSDLNNKVSVTYAMNDSDYPEQYFINLVGNINNQVALEIGSRSDRGSPYVRSKSSGGYTEWKRILTNADLEYSWENFTIGVFATEATVQRQGLVKCLKINTYLKNTTTGVTKRIHSPHWLQHIGQRHPLQSILLLVESLVEPRQRRYLLV